MNNWEKIVQKIKTKFPHSFAKCKNEYELIIAKNQLIGRNSEIIKIFHTLTSEEKKHYSSTLNEIKQEIQKAFNDFTKHIISQKGKKTIEISTDFVNQKKLKFNQDKVLINIGSQHPQFNFPFNNEHPLNVIIQQIHNFCQQRQWKFIPSEDLTTVEKNFTLLNIDEDHPARNSKDCFYINSEKILRTHTTNMTAEQLCDYSKNEQERFVYTIGNVYRNDTDDKTHLPKFTQFDACLIAKNLSLAKLKWILIEFCQFLFGKEMKIRFRSSYFPFTEPSLELDIECSFCHQKGCGVCKQSGWVELLGAGIVSPKVLKRCHIKTKTIALALGVGIERIVMLKYKINDIRFLYKNEWEKIHK